MPHAQKASIDEEMHELNAEADFLEEKTTVTRSANGEDAKIHHHGSDPDAQAMVIDSLRAQVQDLFTQVSQLNGKLVRSYDRVSDLEDELHVTSSNLRQATIKVSQLELERTQHLSALSTGLLVEKSHVTTELNRLMEKATEEAARRGQAETARATIEQELDDLSAGLFDQANRMVAQARIAEARSARKLEETEAALHSAEEVVGALQSQMQMLESEKEVVDRRMEGMRIRMGKGKWVDRSPDRTRSKGQRLLSTHLPYHEFLVFVSHLRTLRTASSQPPSMSTLLPLPFIARLVTEDSDPTVRLDLAPSLNWLSRRSVIAAIHSAQLTVEPMQFTTLLEELAPPNIPSHSHHTHIVCALCGVPIYSSGDSPAGTPTTPNPSKTVSHSASWSTTLFKNVRAGDLSSLTGPSRQLSLQAGAPCTEPPVQVYIFRIEAASSSLPVSLPLSAQSPANPGTRQSIYPLCSSGWCLTRLRATCSLWAFVRTSVVEKIWEEAPLVMFNGATKPGVNGQVNGAANGVVADEHPTPALQTPPKRTKIGLGNLWGSMQRSLSGVREVGSKTPEPVPVPPKADGRPTLPPRDPSRKSLPPPPPTHPTVTHQPKPRRVPPPFKEGSPGVEGSPAASPAPPSTTSSPAPVVSAAAAPPPLPKRNRERVATLVNPELEQKSEANGASHEEVKPVVEPAPPTSEGPEATKGAPAEKSAPEVDAPPTPAAPAPVDATELTPTLVATTGTPKPDTLTAPSISRATSADSFASATEGLSSPASSAGPDLASDDVPALQELTPTSKTPTLPDMFVPAPAAPAPVPDATSAAAAATVPKDDKPPSRTSSPAPPPLPRRAAARGRPTSMLAQQADGEKRSSLDAAPASRGSTDVPAAEVPAPVEQPAPAPPTSAPEPEKGAEKKEEAVENAAPVAEATQVVAPAAGVEAIAAFAAVEEKAVEPEHVVEKAVPAEAEPSSEVAPVPEALPVVVAEDLQESEAPAETEKPHINGEVAPSETEHTEKSEVSQTDAEDALSPEPEDNGQFVGDATWEERTYKELMRLREEMFWARMGAVVA
ncbi:uncharacterized protein BXZ73DRAFT_41547 [Epithele typhae]|uniref:uncharacterized protein n=1 Tax=Epithele typhae TaxID=378194 RepID=UPI0020086771|nr:uncharacterized protein BXZ73DRAFT_41547 [Epithele typhae]KAH9941766.1 hypothetical protein BXZ73DRAFT_41547 [Epithele typhae]